MTLRLCASPLLSLVAAPCQGKPPTPPPPFTPQSLLTVSPTLVTPKGMVLPAVKLMCMHTAHTYCLLCILLLGVSCCSL